MAFTTIGRCAHWQRTPWAPPLSAPVPVQPRKSGWIPCRCTVCRDIQLRISKTSTARQIWIWFFDEMPVVPGGHLQRLHTMDTWQDIFPSMTPSVVQMWLALFCHTHLMVLWVTLNMSASRIAELYFGVECAYLHTLRPSRAWRFWDPA